jgi:hypothetical protein
MAFSPSMVSEPQHAAIATYDSTNDNVVDNGRPISVHCIRTDMIMVALYHTAGLLSPQRQLYQLDIPAGLRGALVPADEHRPPASSACACRASCLWSDGQRSCTRELVASAVRRRDAVNRLGGIQLADRGPASNRDRAMALV